jgi:L-alanine-DL-glutamate epimerase-like enolase superfamily enzyme
VQADAEWCGGASELKKICSVGSLYDVPVIPHAHKLHAAWHLVASKRPTVCPLGEYLVLKMNSYYYFDRNALSPKAGRVNLGDRPGFGMEIAGEHVESRKNLLASL